MPPRHSRWRFHGLKKPKLRQDWNKYNLYNLARYSAPNLLSRTNFQQKWAAKAATRAYHGEHINEKKWKRMFKPTAPAVVPMDPAELAADDGSQFAAGRGSGRDVRPGSDEDVKDPRHTPYMQMLYHPIERRLDTAIFRALFASSARQARQMVVHGHVKVNGKKMIYPGYQLNPGDMFHVAPERVLRSTGRITTPPQPPNPDKPRRKLDKRARAQAKSQDTSVAATVQEGEDLAVEEIEDEPLTEEEAAIPDADKALADTKKTLLDIRQRAADLIDSPPQGRKVSARQKQDLRALKKTLKASLSRAASVTPSTLDDLETQLQSVSSRILAAGEAETATASEAAAKQSQSDPPPSSPPPPGETAAPEPSKDASIAASSGPTDISERWQPKIYMSAFAFIPRYLEVNQRICSAVYLRHPVCKPGASEVPSPFPIELSQLAFHWYLKPRG